MTSPNDLRDRFDRDGFISPIDIMSAEEAGRHRETMEWAESQIGKLHYRPKIHTILRSPLQIVTSPEILDVVEALIGPDILLYNCDYIVKEPMTESHVSWHQDLTYWGFNDDAQVSLWLALSPATNVSGCMRMIPGSHITGQRAHETTQDNSNILYQGQTVKSVDESTAVTCALQPGQASFHHGYTLHASMPNRSTDRRIGLNAQFIAPHMRQLKHDQDSALLVRGTDPYGHFQADIPADGDLDPAAMTRLKVIEDIHRSIAATGD